MKNNKPLVLSILLVILLLTILWFFLGVIKPLVANIQNKKDEIRKESTTININKENNLEEILSNKNKEKIDDTKFVNLGEVVVNNRTLKYKWQYYYTDEKENKVYFIYAGYLEENAVPKDNWNDFSKAIVTSLQEKGIEAKVEVKGAPTVEDLKEAYNERYEEKLEIVGNEEERL